ncbi:MAG: cytosine permease, partial [Bacillus sp. (in: firmicutes)]
MEQINREQLKKEGFNEDILPTKPEGRNWNIGNYASVWMGSVHNIPNYIAVGGLFAIGMSVGQVFSVIMVASIVLALAMVL